MITFIYIQMENRIMSETTKFCPSCGNSVDGVQFCQQCGFEIKPTPGTPPSEVNSTDLKADHSIQTQTGANNYNPSTWNTLEPLISLAGKLSWILIILSTIISIIVAAVALANGGSGGSLIWSIISALISYALAGIFIKPFLYLSWLLSSDVSNIPDCVFCSD